MTPIANVEECLREFFSKEETPQSLSWVDGLTPPHRVLFCLESYHARQQAEKGGYWDPVINLLKMYQCVSHIDSDPELRRQLLGSEKGGVIPTVSEGLEGWELEGAKAYADANPELKRRLKGCGLYTE